MSLYTCTCTYILSNVRHVYMLYMYNVHVLSNVRRVYISLYLVMLGILTFYYI